MDCNNFRQWLISRDGCDAGTSQQARRHREACPDCDRLYSADQGLERTLASGIRTLEAPAGLARRARALTRQDEESSVPKWASWFKSGLAPAMALALMLVFVVWNPFANPLASLDVIGNYALANHTRTDMTMDFKAAETQDPEEWFFKQLNYRITIPTLSRQGFTFVGGRECTLGPRKAAYLFYDDHGKRVSVFILKAGDVKMPLQDNRNYRIDGPHHQVDLWKTQGLVCILVKDRPAASPSMI
ncbi:MAG: hypothetical protein JJV98_15350 [Desulfosarcina sp.]|nr:hypothetical protein [Desulfobacterales bacterium]